MKINRGEGMFKDWDSELLQRSDPAIRYGLFYEDSGPPGSPDGDNGPTGGDAYDGPYSKTPGGRYDRALDKALGYDKNNPNPHNTGNWEGREAGGDDPMGALFRKEGAEQEASDILGKAYGEAASAIAAGEEKAAQAIIEAAKIAAAAVLKMAKIADDRIREFWNLARADLQPIIKQGRFASDEIASMLGIRDSNGELIPYDTEKLAKTPGYQWAFDQGNRALQNSAVGNALSGSNTRATIEYGQGMATQQFTSRLQQLGFLAEGGWNATRDQANAATQTGSNFAQVYSQAGGDLADIYNNQGSNLANVYMSGAETRAGLISGLATAQTNLQMARELGSQRSADSRSAAKYGLAGNIIGSYVGSGGWWS